jgi:hypothetical protein
MKKKLILGTVILCITLLCGSPAIAALLNLDFGYPKIYSNLFGSYSYDSTDNTFTAHSDPYLIELGGGSSAAFNYPTASWDLEVEIDESGNFVGGASGDDLTIIGEVTIDGQFYSGTLLTGEISAFGWENSLNDTFEFAFDVTGGALADLYGGIDGLGGINITSLAAAFDGDWSSGHSNAFIKVETSVVPIPPSAFLLGSGGLMIIALGFRKRRAKKLK